MISKRHEERRVSTQLPEVPALRFVLRSGLVKVIATLVSHEGVAEVHMEIGCICQRVLQRAGVDLWVHVGVQVRIRLHGEGEWLSGGSLRSESVLLAGHCGIGATLGDQPVAIRGAGC